MANKLKNMKLTSIDLCGRGANQEAKIALFKSTDNGKGGEKGMGWWNRLKKSIASVTDTELDDDVMKQIIDEAGRATASDEADAITKAMAESLKNILENHALNGDARADLIAKSVEQFSVEIEKARKRWNWDEPDDEADDEPGGDSLDDEDDKRQKAKSVKTEKLRLKKKSEGERKEMGTIETIDVEKMSAEDQAVLKSLQEKYTNAAGSAAVKTVTAKVEKVERAGNTEKAEMNPEIKKALDEVAELKKSIEMRDMVGLCKKYEIIGKKADEMAEQMYELKKSDENAYNSVIAAYDAVVASTKQSGIFKEFGSGRVADGSAQGKVEAAAAEIRKSDPKMSYSASIVKACDDNPELKSEYGKM